MTAPIDPNEETAAESSPAAGRTASRTIGRYTLVKILGEGGMGVVWRAHDPTLDREVAIKLLKRHDAEPLRKRLHREARAMARLKHPNVLTVYESGTEGNLDYIAMELVEGSSLDEWLDKSPPRDAVIEALLAAGRGLAAAHRAGLVHRDFKPHNILRDKDGRVLVTDFGLARGLGDDASVELTTAAEGVRGAEPISGTAALDETVDATPTPSPTTSVRTDSVLDSPLTQTGAMIGTPAYMAPEQFRGAPPDPRTDQFAFCVTAWQALTGTRPYDGKSLDELRAAASAGVAQVRADLPPALRALLVRGLDPDPTKRWPDMDTLLDAFTRALRAPLVRRRRIGAVVSAVGMAVLILVLRLVRDDAASAPADGRCEPADQAFAAAWSPVERDALWRDLRARDPDADQAAFERVAAPLDNLRLRWFASYLDACKASKAPRRRDRLGCLLGARDEVQIIGQALRLAPPGTLAQFDVHGFLPTLAVCDGPTPVARPAIPADKRVRVLNVLAHTLGLRGPNLTDALARLRQEAEDIGWPPLVPMILAGGANMYLRRGDPAHARALADEILELTKQSSDVRTIAMTRMALLEASMQELAHPDAPRAPRTTGALHPEVEAALLHARAAVKQAGNDPLYAGAIALVEATALADRAGWSTHGKPFERAIELAQEARRTFESAGDIRRAARAVTVEAELVLARGDDRALDDAVFLVRTAEELLRRASLDVIPSIERLRARIDLARGDYDAAHRAFDRVQDRPATTELTTITGTTLDREGTPRGGALVVAWRGELHGDPRRLYTDASTIDGDWTTSEADGSFTLHAAPGSAIAAETDAGALRSSPQVVSDGPLVLRLAPTESASGTAEGKRLSGIDAVARYTAGAATLVLHAPLQRDRSWRLDGLPRGPRTLGALGPAGTGERRVVAPAGAEKLAWPAGAIVEVIARLPALEDGATAWVFRGRLAPATRADAEGIVAKASDIAVGPLARIATHATDAGRELYRAGDRHAVFTGTAAGEVTACAAAMVAPSAPVTCTTLSVASEPGSAVSVTPVVLGN